MKLYLDKALQVFSCSSEGRKVENKKTKLVIIPKNEIGMPKRFETDEWVAASQLKKLERSHRELPPPMLLGKRTSK